MRLKITNYALNNGLPDRFGRVSNLVPEPYKVVRDENGFARSPEARQRMSETAKLNAQATRAQREQMYQQTQGIRNEIRSLYYQLPTEIAKSLGDLRGLHTRRFERLSQFKNTLESALKEYQQQHP